MSKQPPAVPPRIPARPWRVWAAMMALLSLLVFYDSAKFQRFLLDVEFQAGEIEAALEPSWMLETARVAHEALVAIMTAWETVEAGKRYTGIAALIELERDLTRGAGELLVLDLVAATGGTPQESGSAPGRGLTVIEADPAAPARPPVYLMVGDSVMLSPLGTSLGEKVQRVLGGRVVRRAIVGTGMSRPDKFDWTAQLRKMIEQHSPKAVVVLMGVNDVNATRNAAGQLEAFGGDAFRISYENYLRGFLRAAEQAGVEVVWVETPVTENLELNAKLKVVNSLQRSVLAEFKGARYVDTWSLLADSEGRPRPFLRLDNERQFHPWNLDGIHLTAEAGKYVADAIFPRMTGAVRRDAQLGETTGARPPAPEISVAARRYRYLSRMMSRDTDLFYVPAGGPLPPSGTTLLVFHRLTGLPLERWVSKVLVPLAGRHGIAIVAQQEPALLDPSGRPRPWPETSRAMEQLLAEIRRAADRAGDAGPFGGLMVASEGDLAGAGISVLARGSLPCMSLVAAPAPPPPGGLRPGRAPEPAPNVEEPALASSPGRMATVARELAASANSPLGRALRERLRPAGFSPRVQGSGSAGRNWDEQVSRHVAWHGLCDRLRDSAWPHEAPDGGRALFETVEQDLPDLTRTLLTRGVSPQVRDPEGNTPLVRAVRADRREAAALLLAAGADPDIRNDDGWTALAWAAARGNIVLAEQLIAAKARVDIRDRASRTPLMVAAWHGFPALVDLLVRAKARVELQDRLGETALHKAAKYGRRAAMEHLFAAGANANQSDPKGKTALMTAAFYGQTEAAESLLAHGAAVDARDKGGWTALMVAASTGKLETLRLLVERGADPLALANDRRNALILAACEGHAGVVPYLLSLRAQRDATDASGQTALLCATRKGRTAAVKALLQGGASADIPDAQGNTALLVASRENGIELAEALIQAGADPDRRNLAGDSPRSIARAKGHERILQAFGRGAGRGRGRSTR